MTRQRFSLDKYEKDRKKCYEMSKSGINLGQLSKTEDRIMSKKIGSFRQRLFGPEEVRMLMSDTDKCKKKSVLDLCTLPIKDRNMDMCRYCDVNI